MKYTNEEPAERPFQVSLSHAGVVALVNHHIRSSKKIAPQLGKTLAARDKASAAARLSFRPNKFLIEHLIKEAQSQIAAHQSRARGLLSFLK